MQEYLKVALENTFEKTICVSLMEDCSTLELMKREKIFVPFSTNEGQAEIIGRTETITKSFRNEIRT